MLSFRDSWDVWRKKVNAALGNVEEIDADEVVYSNTTSGLTATNVQSAIDEVVSGVGSLDGSDIAYDGTASSLSATNVQGAIDEVVTDLGTANGKISALEGKFVLKTLTGTTTSGGWIVTDIPFSTTKIIPVCTSLPVKFAFAAKQTDFDAWGIKVMNHDFTALASTEVTITYMEL